MTQVLHERTIRLIPILMLLMAVAVVVPAMAVPPNYESVELIEIGDQTFDIRLTFNESVAWAVELTKESGYLKVEVKREGAPTTPDFDTVPIRKMKDRAPTMDVTVAGSLKEYDLVTVYLTPNGAGQIYSLDDDGNKWYPVSGSLSFEYILPPEFVSAETNIDGDKISVKFDKEMADPAGKHDQFNFTIGEEEFAFTAAAEHAQDAEKIVLTCGGEIKFGDVVTVSYKQGDVKSADGGVLVTFAGEAVTNNVPEPPKALHANTTTDGAFINITFNMEMDDPAGKDGQFTFFVNDVKRDFSSVELSADKLNFSFEVVGEALIAAGDVVNVSYTRGDVTSQDKGKLASFENLTVKNNVPDSPVVVAAKTNKDGDRILITFDKEMADPVGTIGQFKCRVNDGDELGFWGISPQDDDEKAFVLGVSAPVYPPFGSSDTITLNYTRGSVRSADHGVLLNFTDLPVENVMPPEFVQIDPITDAGAATKTVTLNFSKPVWWASSLIDTQAITVDVTGDRRVITEIGPRNYEDASRLLDVTFSGPAIKDGEWVHVSITGCGALKIKETSSENNSMQRSPAEQWSGWYTLPPKFDKVTFQSRCEGTSVVLGFDKEVRWNTKLNDTHITVTVDGTPVEFKDVDPSLWWSSTKEIILVLSKPITEDGRIVNVTITDKGAAEIKEPYAERPMAGGASIEKTYAAPPEFEKILVTDAEKGEVTLYFNKPVFFATLYGTDVQAMIDGEYRSIAASVSSRDMEDAADTIVVELRKPMITEGQKVEITITASGASKIQETIGKISMLAGNTRSVTHTAETAPVLVKAWTNEFGNAIIAEFDRNMAEGQDPLDWFRFVVNDEEKTFTAYKLDGDNKKRIVLSISDRDTIKAGDTVNLTYTPGSVAAEDGGLLAAFDERVTNKKRPSLTGIEVTKVAGDENQIKLLFDEPVYWDEELIGGLDIMATVAGGAREVVDIENRTAENATDELTVTVKGAEIAEGQSVTITVTKSGADKIIFNDAKPLIECTSSTQYDVYHGAPYVTGMFLGSHVERQVYLVFSDYVSWGDLVNGTHIIVEVDGEARRAYKVEADSGYWLDITFDGDIIKVGQMINVTITDEGAKAISSYYGTLAPRYEFNTTFTKTDGPVIETVWTNEYGNLVYITFDKALESYYGYGKFQIHINGWEYPVTFQDAWLEGENKTLVLEICNDEWTQVIKPDNSLAISYSGGYIRSEDGGVLAEFEKHPVENKVTKAFDQIQPLNDGWTLVSTPRWIDPTASEFVNADLVYKYDAATGTFITATVSDVKPVEALYVKTAGPAWFAANFGDFQPLSTKELSAGWNLISVGTEGDAKALLSPLRFIQVGQVEGTGITTLVSQGALNRGTADLYLPTLTETDWSSLGYTDLSPVDGYWIYMNGGKDFGVLPGDSGYPDYGHYA